MLFASFKDPARRVLYTSEILDGGPEVGFHGFSHR